jgi:hypothetical protein
MFMALWLMEHEDGTVAISGDIKQERMRKNEKRHH